MSDFSGVLTKVRNLIISPTCDLRGEFLGVAGTGKRIQWKAINIYRFQDGKVIETWQLLDVWSLMRQIRQAG